MGNRYASVLHTHLRRPTGIQDGLLPALGLLAFVCAFSIAVSLPRHSRPDPITALTVGTGVVLTGLGLWTKLREQLLSDRRHLWPHFVAPHVVVFAALSLGVVCLIPLLLASQGGIGEMALMAYAAALFASTGLFAAVPSPLIQALGVACFAGLICAATGQRLWEIASEDQHAMAVALLLAAAAVACTATVLRMLKINEDHPRYFQNSFRGIQQASFQATDPALVREQYPRWWPTPRLCIDALTPGRTGLIARSRRWRAVVRLNWFFCVFLPAINLAMLRGFHFGNGVGAARVAMLTLSTYYLFFPAGTVSGDWIRAWPCLELDSLRPVTRREIIREIGMAIAIQTFQAWAIVAAVFIVGTISLQIPTLLLPTILIGSLTMQPLMFGITIWAMRFKSVGLQMLVCIPVIIVSTAALAFWQDPTSATWRPVVCMIACALALIGIGLTWLASRLWLNTELG
jgi:hypothetical protein